MATPLWSDNPSPLDLLGFADVTAPVVEAVLREKLDPVTVGIEGDWGSGKTTMLELLATELRQDKTMVVIETHPWEYDPATDPKATLIAEVLGEIHAEAEKRKNLTDKAREKFKALARRIQVSKAIKLGVNSALSMGLPKIDELLGLFKEDAETVPDPTLQGFRDEFQALMEEDLTEIERVVVLVDDLDRCLPETVVATLEAVKLFLSVPKMAFVLAADRRAVSYAVATKYDPSPQALELGRQYLEKIVHIPVRVPTLGRGETEAYLALLMLQRHFGDDAGLTPFVDHCDKRRAAGEGDVLEGLPQERLDGKARGDLQLAAMLAPVLYERLNGNPRRLKRFLNAYWMRATVAGRRGIKLQPNALAKLMVLEELEDAAFNALLGWMREGVLADRLKDLEAGKAVQGAGGETSAEALQDWAKLKPSLAKVMLEPYLRLAAALRSQVGPEAGLRPDVAELVEALMSDKRAEQKHAQEKKLPGAPQETRLAVARYLVDELKSNPDRQERIAPALAKLVEDDTVADAIIPGLQEFSAERVEGPLVVHLAPAKGGHTGIKAVVRGWVESDHMDEGFAALARKNLGMDVEGS